MPLFWKLKYNFRPKYYESLCRNSLIHVPCLILFDNSMMSKKAIKGFLTVPWALRFSRCVSTLTSTILKLHRRKFLCKWKGSLLKNLSFILYVTAMLATKGKFLSNKHPNLLVELSNLTSFGIYNVRYTCTALPALLMKVTKLSQVSLRERVWLLSYLIEFFLIETGTKRKVEWCY